jgi:hypothetical protein
VANASGTAWLLRTKPRRGHAVSVTFTARGQWDMVEDREFSQPLRPVRPPVVTDLYPRATVGRAAIVGGGSFQSGTWVCESSIV